MKDIEKLDIYYSYQCEKNVELYMLNHVIDSYPLSLANEWDFIYNQGELFSVDLSIKVQYPEKKQKVIKISEIKYQLNMKNIFDIKVVKKPLFDINKDIVFLLNQNLFVGINLDYAHLVDDDDNIDTHSFVIMKHKGNKLLLCDPKKDKIYTEWISFEKIYDAYNASSSDRKYYTYLSVPENFHKNEKSFINSALLYTAEHFKDYLENCHNGICSIKCFISDLKRLYSEDTDKIKLYYILELVYSLLIYILNQRNNYKVYLKFLGSHFSQINNDQTLEKLKLICDKWEEIRNLFFKIKQLDGKRFEKVLETQFMNMYDIVNMEEQYINSLYTIVHVLV